MRASRVTAHTLVNAAMEIGVRLECDAIGRQFRVKLYPETRPEMYRPPCKRCREYNAQHSEHFRECRCRRWEDERGDAKYQRSSASMYGNGRRVHAVCWHGFRDFFRAVYRTTPDARFVTAMATWKNADHFEANFAETGHKNIGSMMYPVAAASACRCPEQGYTERFSNTFSQTWEPEPIRDTYGQDEADGAACRAMANALRAR